MNSKMVRLLDDIQQSFSLSKIDSKPKVKQKKSNFIEKKSIILDDDEENTLLIQKEQNSCSKYSNSKEITIANNKTISNKSNLKQITTENLINQSKKSLTFNEYNLGFIINKTRRRLLKLTHEEKSQPENISFFGRINKKSNKRRYSAEDDDSQVKIQFKYSTMEITKKQEKENYYTSLFGNFIETSKKLFIPTLSKSSTSPHKRNEGYKTTSLSKKVKFNSAALVKLKKKKNELTEKSKEKIDFNSEKVKKKKQAMKYFTLLENLALKYKQSPHKARSKENSGNLIDMSNIINIFNFSASAHSINFAGKAKSDFFTETNTINTSLISKAKEVKPENQEKNNLMDGLIDSLKETLKKEKDEKVNTVKSKTKKKATVKSNNSNQSPAKLRLNNQSFNTKNEKFSFLSQEKCQKENSENLEIIESKTCYNFSTSENSYNNKKNESNKEDDHVFDYDILINSLKKNLEIEKEIRKTSKNNEVHSIYSSSQSNSNFNSPLRNHNSSNLEKMERIENKKEESIIQLKPLMKEKEKKKKGEKGETKKQKIEEENQIIMELTSIMSPHSVQTNLRGDKNLNAEEEKNDKKKKKKLDNLNFFLQSSSHNKKGSVSKTGKLTYKHDEEKDEDFTLSKKYNSGNQKMIEKENEKENYVRNLINNNETYIFSSNKNENENLNRSPHNNHGNQSNINAKSNGDLIKLIPIGSKNEFKDERNYNSSHVINSKNIQECGSSTKQVSQSNSKVASNNSIKSENLKLQKSKFNPIIKRFSKEVDFSEKKTSSLFKKYGKKYFSQLNMRRITTNENKLRIPKLKTLNSKGESIENEDNENQ